MTTKYAIKYRYSDTGWLLPSVELFDDDGDAYFKAAAEEKASKESYQKCVDAGIDVPFIVEFKVVPMEKDCIGRWCQV
jgi:hypothetical protein